VTTNTDTKQAKAPAVRTGQASAAKPKAKAADKPPRTRASNDAKLPKTSLPKMVGDGLHDVPLDRDAVERTGEGLVMHQPSNLPDIRLDEGKTGGDDELRKAIVKFLKDGRDMGDVNVLVEQAHLQLHRENLAVKHQQWVDADGVRHGDDVPHPALEGWR
jgi:hypothetical protein